MFDSLKSELVNMRLHPTESNAPSYLYHYSNATGLLGICDSQEMWATHTSFMNDTKEISYTKELVESICERLLEDYPLEEDKSYTKNTSLIYRDFIFRLSYKSMRPKPNNDIYVVCFCRDKDLLSQWRGYGEVGSGYSIGFDTEGLNKIDLRFGLYKVIYSETEQMSILEKLVSTVFASLKKEIVGATMDEALEIADKHARIFEEEVLLFSTYFKHPSFKEENEWRFVYSREKSSSFKGVFYRPGESMIIPYVKFGWGSSERTKLPIVDVTIGPTQPNVASKSVLMALESLYPDIEVTDSKIPLR